jgi:hypothetical protein
MSAKTIRYLTAALIIIITATVGWRFYVAEMLDWELRDATPTRSTEDSKHFGIYVSDLSFNPTEVDLGGVHYRIERIWVEHRTEPDRICLFMTRQKIYPELILCVEMKSLKTADIMRDLEIKNANVGRFHFYASNGVWYTEIGRLFPRSFVLLSRSSREEAQIWLLGSIRDVGSIRRDR